MVFVGFNLVIPFMPLFIQELGIHDRGQVAALAGLQQTASAIGLAVFAPIWGSVGDRIGRKPMFLRAVGLGAILIGGLALVRNIGQLLVLRFLIGALTGVQAPAMALVSTLAPRARTGYVVGLIQMAVYSGMFAGPLVGGLLADVIGFRRTFLLGSAFLALAALAIILFVREGFVKPPPRDRAGLSWLGDLKKLVAAEHLFVLLATVFCISFAVQGLPPILPLFIQQLPALPGTPAALTGIALGTAGVCAAISAPLLGRLAARVGYGVILAAAAAAASLASTTFLLIGSFPPVLAVEVVLGAAAGGLMPIAFALLALRTPRERRGAIYGLSTSMSALGQATGPLSAGLLAAALGLRVSYLLAAAMFMVIVVLTLSTHPRRVATSIAG